MKETSLHKLEEVSYPYHRIKMVKHYMENGQSQAGCSWLIKLKTSLAQCLTIK